MAKSAPKSVTINNVSTDVRSLTKMVESGFADVYKKFAEVNRKMDNGFTDVRAELSKKADKVDLVALKTNVEDLKDDLNRLTKATKIGFDRVHQELESKVNRDDLGEIGEGVEGIRQRFSSLDNRPDTFVTHESRLVRLEKEVGIAV